MANKAANTTKKAIGEFMKKKEKPPDELFAQKTKNEADIKELEEKLKELAAERDDAIGQIGAPIPTRALPKGACLITHAHARLPLVGAQAISCPTLCRWTTTRTTTW
jgi:seryl-tRNA synthetase